MERSKKGIRFDMSEHGENKYKEVSNNKTFEKIEIKKIDSNEIDNKNEDQNDAKKNLPIINDNKIISTKNNETIIPLKTNEFDQLPSIVRSSHLKKEANSMSVNINIFNVIKYVDYFPLKAIKVINHKITIL
jgi:hypothetical protein